MKEQLQLLIAKLAKDRNFFNCSEQATKQALVLPLLAKLGWDIFNIQEVLPEYQLESRRVDYCLRIDQKNRVFIEVKRIDVELEKHEQQLLEYSFKEGVELSILTNGVVWWLYLPSGSGKWQERRFFTIDLLQQSPEAVAQSFMDFLCRERVKSGEALGCAQAVHKGREKENLIQQTIPKVWEKLFNDPDEQLLELFAAKVEGVCGYRPDLDV